MTVTKLLCPSYEADAAEFFFAGGPKAVQNPEKKCSLQNCHEAHQMDQRNVLNAKMYGGGGGGQNRCFFQGSKVVKTGPKWQAKFHHRHFVFVQPPPPPLTISIRARHHWALTNTTSSATAMCYLPPPTPRVERTATFGAGVWHEVGIMLVGSRPDVMAVVEPRVEHRRRPRGRDAQGQKQRF